MDAPQFLILISEWTGEDGVDLEEIANLNSRERQVYLWCYKVRLSGVYEEGQSER